MQGDKEEMNHLFCEEKYCDLVGMDTECRLDLHEVEEVNDEFECYYELVEAIETEEERERTNG